MVKKACWAAMWNSPDPNTHVRSQTFMHIYVPSSEKSRDERIAGIADFRSEKMGTPGSGREPVSKEQRERDRQGRLTPFPGPEHRYCVHVCTQTRVHTLTQTYVHTPKITFPLFPLPFLISSLRSTYRGWLDELPSSQTFLPARGSLVLDLGPHTQMEVH